MMQEKREVSSLVPYRRVEGGLEFYLQMRDKNAKTNPQLFGFFGGGLESGETPHDALVREVREELEYMPHSPRYFCRYELARVVMHVYIEEVGVDFEDHVVVREGEYGKFLGLDEIGSSNKVNEGARVVTREITRCLD